MSYHYEIEFKRSAEVANADALLRLPLSYREDASVEDKIFQPQQLDKHPVSAKDIARETARNPTITRALSLTQHGWPNKFCTNPDLKPYLTHRQELSIEQGCLVGNANRHTSFLATTNPQGTAQSTPWNCTHEGNSSQSRVVARSRQ